jgi:hypothetical protein
MSTRKLKIPYEKRGDDKIYTLNGVAQLTATKQKVPVVSSPKVKEALDINSQIEEFFKSGKKINKVHANHRSIPEWGWWQDNYPKNYRR